MRAERRSFAKKISLSSIPGIGAVQAVFATEEILLLEKVGFSGLRMKY